MYYDYDQVSNTGSEDVLADEEYMREVVDLPLTVTQFSGFVRDPADPNYADQLAGLMSIAEYAYMFDHLINQCLRGRPVYDGYAGRLRRYVLTAFTNPPPRREMDRFWRAEFDTSRLAEVCATKFGAYHRMLMGAVCGPASDRTVSDAEFLKIAHSRLASSIYSRIVGAMTTRLDSDLTVYRGIQLAGDKGADLELSADLRDINGSVLTPTSFTSTSLSPNVALNFCGGYDSYLDKLETPKCGEVQGVVLRIRIPAGTPIVPMLMCGLSDTSESEIAIAASGRLEFEEGGAFAPEVFEDDEAYDAIVLTGNVVFRYESDLPAELPDLT